MTPATDTPPVITPDEFKIKFLREVSQFVEMKLMWEQKIRMATIAWAYDPSPQNWGIVASRIALGQFLA